MSTPLPAGESISDVIRLRACSRIEESVAFSGVVALAVAAFVVELWSATLGGVLLAALGIVACISLLDVFLTRAATYGYHRWGTVLFTEEGISVSVRKESAFQRYEGGYEVRSVLLRRHLRGFARPNFAAWSNWVTLFIREGGSGNQVLSGHLHFRGPSFMTGGLRETMGRLNIEIPRAQVDTVVTRVLASQGHVHLSANLAAAWGIPMTSCPDIPGYIPRLGGACLSATPTLTSFGSSPLSGGAGASTHGTDSKR